MTDARPVAQGYVDALRGSSVTDGSLLPGWAGIATLFAAPVADPSSITTDVVAAGVPFDSTASSRPGAAEAPLAIRTASRIMAAQLASAGSHPMVDTRTGQEFRYRTPSISDAGDLPVFPTDPRRNFASL